LIDLELVLLLHAQIPLLTLEIAVDLLHLALGATLARLPQPLSESRPAQAGKTETQHHGTHRCLLCYPRFSSLLYGVKWPAVHRIAALFAKHRPAASLEAPMSDHDTTADRPWTLEAVHQLKELAREGVPAPVISLKLKRSLASVHAKLVELGIRVPAGA
jgi:hypothetical protein